MRTENREKFVFFHLFFYFVAPAGFEPATSPPKGDVLPLHHGALDSFVPVVLAARVVAASEPVPVCCASAIRRRGAVSSSLAHDPPIWVLSAYPILFPPLRAGVILPEHQTPYLCGWLSLWCRQDSNLHGCFPRSVLRNLRCPTTISPSFCVRLPFRHYTICRSFPAVVLLRASRRTARNHHTDCLCALEARKPLPGPEAAKHLSLKNSNHEQPSASGRSHFNPAPSIFPAFRSASTSSRLNGIAEFLAAPAFIPWIFFRLI